MFEKIEELERRYQELEALLSDPAVIANQPEFRRYSREHADLSDLVAAHRRYKKVLAEIAGNRDLLADPDMKEMAEEELSSLEEEQSRLAAEIRLLLLPKDPNDSKNVILEIRAGTGGDESALFAGDLFRMYSRFAEASRWRVEVISASESERGQIKNRAKAMKVLKSRILDSMASEQNARLAADRKQQVGSGDRSERIRTYNFPQGRMTDHRIGLTLYRLDALMEGDIGEVVDSLRAHYQMEALQAQSE